MAPRRELRRIAAATATLVGVLVARTAGAYRPFDQTDADVAELHEVEWELGPVGVLWRGDGASYVPGLIFNYGFAPRFELVVDAHGAFLWGGADAAARRRQQQVGLLVKHVVREGSLQGQVGPSVAVELGALLPTVPVSGGLGAALTLIVSQRWRNATVHLNAEGDLTRERNPLVVGGFIVEGPERWPVRPVAEALVSRERDEDPTFSALCGLIWRATEALSPDLAVRGAEQGGNAVLELRAGLTWSY